MNYTTNYHLPQWVETDRIQMEDFNQMCADVGMAVGKKCFEKLINEMKERNGVTQDDELTAEALKELATQFKAEYKNQLGTDFPDDP